MATRRLSLVRDYGEYASSCGYCGSRSSGEETSWSHGMMAEVLSVEAYQDLIDRGWRRSGRWLYQPLNHQTCCQLLTIRLDVHKFKPNREQRRALRKWEGILAGAPLAPHPKHELHNMSNGERGSGCHEAGWQHAQRGVDGQQGEGAVWAGGQRQGVAGMAVQCAASTVAAQPSGEQPAAGCPGSPTGLVSDQSCEGMQAGEHSVPSGQADMSQPCSPAQPRGSSPKRPHEDLEPAVCAAPAGASPSATGLHGGAMEGSTGVASKRQRGPGGESALIDQSAGPGADARKGGDRAGQGGLPGGRSGDGGWVEGGSPTAQLACQMQHMLGKAGSQSGLVPEEETSAANSARAAPPVGTVSAGADSVQQQLNARRDALRCALCAALERCVSLQLLPGPASRYPAPSVQQPSAKLRKSLPADVSLTAPYPLAVAAAARRLSGDTGGTKARPAAGAAPPADAVAHLLVAQASFPEEVQRVEVARGHLNFVLCSEPGSSHSLTSSSAVAAVGGPAAAPAAECPPPGASTQRGKRDAHTWALQGRGGRCGSAAEAAEGGGAGSVHRFEPGAQPPPAAAAGGQAVSEGGCRAGPDPADAARGSPNPSASIPGAREGGELGGVPRGVPRHFEFVMHPSNPQLIPLEFDLYRRYQILHHGDDPQDVTPSSFNRFLCESPLRPSPPSQYPPGGAPACGFGSFHQQYWLDGRLVAVGVVDILPRCLSSVYLFWDPHWAAASLGKVSALKEIEWVAAAAASCPSLHYYYLGFYIHNCHRMRYKGDYYPSDLLCPTHKCWVPLDRCRQALEQDGCVPLSQLPGALEGLGQEHLVHDGKPMQPPTKPSEDEVAQVRLFIQGGQLGRGQTLSLRALKQAGALSPTSEASLTSRISTWIAAVGPCWRTLLYHL